MVYIKLDEKKIARLKREVQSYQDDIVSAVGTDFMQNIAESEKGMIFDIIRGLESEAAVDVEQKQRDMDKWIDVNERLPERDVRVLVYLKEKVGRYTRIDTDRIIAKKVGWVRWGNDVTHWMSLPKPPEPQ